MRYGAALIAEAERPSTYTLGRFTYRARPVSAPAMLRMHAATGGDPRAQIVALAGVLRAAFPFRWWYRLWPWGDPVRVIMRLPSDLRTLVIQSLFTIPGSRDSATEELSPVERMRREQRAAVHGAGHAGGPTATLATAVAYVRAHYGDAWYYNPPRWATVDGYVPFPVVWVEYVGLETVTARQRLERAAGAMLATGGKETKRLHDATVRAAFPGEPSMVS